MQGLLLSRVLTDAACEEARYRAAAALGKPCRTHLTLWDFRQTNGNSRDGAITGVSVELRRLLAVLRTVTSNQCRATPHSHRLTLTGSACLLVLKLGEFDDVAEEEIVVSGAIGVRRGGRLSACQRIPLEDTARRSGGHRDAARRAKRNGVLPRLRRRSALRCAALVCLRGQ